MTLMVKINSAYRHLEGYENLPDIGLAARYTARKRLTSKIKRLIYLGLINGNANEVDIESLKKYLTYETNIVENYMSLKEFTNLLEIKNTDDRMRRLRISLNKLGSDSPFEFIVVDFPINLQYFFITKSSVERFLKDYIPVEELKSRYDYSSAGWHLKFQKFDIRPLFLTNEKQFLTKSEFEILVNDCASKTVIKDIELTSHVKGESKFKLPSSEYDLGIYLSDYYTLEESKQILSIEILNHFYLIVKDYNLTSKVAKNGLKYIKKVQVDKVKILQIELRQKYISLQDAKEIAASLGILFHVDYIEGEPVDSLLRPFFKGKKRMYSKEEFNDWLDKRNKKTEFFSVSMESDFNTFKYRMNIKGIDLNNLGPFTSETWLQFISSRLNKSKASRQTVDININRYVYCTENLINLVSLTKKCEIYSVTSNDINTLFNKIPQKDSKIFYLYLKQLNNQLIAKKIKAFDFNKVNDPFKSDLVSQDKSIYEYEVYKKVFNYTKDISLQKERVIKDTLQETSTGKKPKYLASSWLYVLLHLNNAWRHSDVITFRQVNLSGTQITDLNWMLENEISDEDVDYIIKQVYRAEFMISKTQVKNYFFCSEELKKPFATAIAICQLRNNALSPLRESIIDFGNKKQNFSDARSRHYFELYDNEEFYFSSRKMNRSLLSYIYVLLSKMQKGTAGLKTIQKMRGHVEKETTYIYVDIPEEELNFLSRQLFTRGSFGFIYDTFLDVLQGVEIDREKRTTEVQLLEKFFGGIYKIVSSPLFVNHTKLRQLVS